LTTIAKLVFQNRHDATFADVSRLSGTAITVPQVSRGLAIGDLFNTGQMDIVIENLVGGPMILESHPDPANHWISLSLAGVKEDRLALNARVSITAGGLTQTSEVRSGGSYLSQNDLRLHFGIGKAKTLDKLEIKWPDGELQLLHGIEADHFYQIKQGATPVLIHYAGRPAN
jgi:hypothetical protein